MKKVLPDLEIALVLVLLTLVSMTEALAQTPVRTALGLLLTLFLPGYALIAALFPKRKDIGGIERIALSFGLSIAVTPLLGLALNYTPFGIRPEPVLAAVSGFTILCIATAYVRRSRLPRDERFVAEIASRQLLSGTKVDKALTVTLVCAILLSVAALVYVIVTPKQGEKFTEFYILGPNGKADGYPTSLKAGGNGTVIVGVVNHEYDTVGYRVAVSAKGSIQKEKGIVLAHNQTYQENYTFTAAWNGTQKVEFLLYRENVSEPYRSLHLWVTA